MKECPNLRNCGFVKKYEVKKSLQCKGFINMYCKGIKQEQCKRKQFKENNGYAPSDDMLPNGLIIHE